MVKSFEIDHTKLKAPCIRLADEYIKNGVVVEKVDIRFETPNTKTIDDAVMHSMEHLLATAFKEVFMDDMIDLSPMGCKTGFYFTFFNCANAINKIQEALRKSPSAKIPKPTEVNCGSYKMHNIKAARKYLDSKLNELWIIENKEN
jgi:S-ribosylhomocysteine lyase